MPRLILVLRDLYPARLSEGASAALPRLNALEQWLAQADTDPEAGGWRQSLQRESRRADLRTVPPASIAAAAVADLPADLPVWLATPVHYVAGLDTVRVHPAGLLYLNRDEQQALERDFTRVFAGSGWSLHATGRRELLLVGGLPDEAGDVRSHDPALWLGADPRSGLPAGQGADQLRRFGAELEMWLHEHPVNVARLARGLLNANALWVWGGGARVAQIGAVTPPHSAAAAIAWADDLFVDGLARLTGATVERPPERWPLMTRAVPAAGADVLVVCELGAAPDARTLSALERDWIAPAFGAWRNGRFRDATLLVGTRAVTLERAPVRSLWRKLRRTRPWWETLLQC